MIARFVARLGSGGPRGYVGRHRAPRVRATVPLGVMVTRVLGLATTGHP